jgi:DNA-binding NarL/FixJ family response regulator
MEHQTTRILIADGHPLVRGALREIVASAVERVEILESGDLEELTREFETNPAIDLVLLDLAMPGVRGLSGLIYLRAQHPGVPVVVVSGNDNRQAMRRCIDLGASGFIPKSTEINEIRAAISQILSGEMWTPPDVDFGAPAERGAAETLCRLEALTPQQKRVLLKLSEGLHNRQIASDFSITETTVKSHISSILNRLEVKSRTQAVTTMTKTGIIKLWTLNGVR